MNHFAIPKNAFSACEEVMSPFGFTSDRRNPPVFCPKPRRAAPLPVDPVRHRWRYASHQLEPSDSKAGADLLEIFLLKGGENNEVDSSPPFFCGSPPSRAVNPVVLDERFGEDRPLAPFPAFPIVPSSASGGGSPMSPRKGCVRSTTNFGFAPAAVRIEGFDCLDHRRRRSCSGITAVA